MGEREGDSHRRLERAKAPTIIASPSGETEARAAGSRGGVTVWVQAGARSDTEEPEAMRKQ